MGAVPKDDSNDLKQLEHTSAEVVLQCSLWCPTTVTKRKQQQNRDRSEWLLLPVLSRDSSFTGTTFHPHVPFQNIDLVITFTRTTERSKPQLCNSIHCFADWR